MTLVSRQHEPHDEEKEHSTSKGRIKLSIAVILLVTFVGIGYSITSFSVDKTKPRSEVSHGSRALRACSHPLFHSLRHILLAINFNHPYYRNADILLQYYKEIFPNFVICGPAKDPRKKYDIIVIKHPMKQRGFFGFQCLPEAVKRNPGYDGYLYINDDMLVNWWNLLELDKTKIWFGCPISFNNINLVGEPARNNWWKRADSAAQCTKAFNYVYDNIATNWMLDIYNRNSEGRKICFSCWSDIYYIPGHLSFPFTRFAEIFYSNKVFLEASVPTILSFLDSRKNFILLDGKYLPDRYAESIDYSNGSAESPLWQEYNRKLIFIHPYKLFGARRFHKTNVRNYRKFMVEPGQKIISERCLDIVLQDDQWNNY